MYRKFLMIVLALSLAGISACGGGGGGGGDKPSLWEDFDEGRIEDDGTADDTTDEVQVRSPTNVLEVSINAGRPIDCDEYDEYGVVARRVNLRNSSSRNIEWSAAVAEGSEEGIGVDNFETRGGRFSFNVACNTPRAEDYEINITAVDHDNGDAEYQATLAVRVDSNPVENISRYEEGTVFVLNPEDEGVDLTILKVVHGGSGNFTWQAVAVEYVPPAGPEGEADEDAGEIDGGEYFSISEDTDTRAVITIFKAGSYIISTTVTDNEAAESSTKSLDAEITENINITPYACVLNQGRCSGQLRELPTGADLIPDGGEEPAEDSEDPQEVETEMIFYGREEGFIAVEGHSGYRCEMEDRALTFEEQTITLKMVNLDPSPETVTVEGAGQAEAEAEAEADAEADGANTVDLYCKLSLDLGDFDDNNLPERIFENGGLDFGVLEVTVVSDQGQRTTMTFHAQYLVHPNQLTVKVVPIDKEGNEIDAVALAGTLKLYEDVGQDEGDDDDTPLRFKIKYGMPPYEITSITSPRRTIVKEGGDEDSDTLPREAWRWKIAEGTEDIIEFSGMLDYTDMEAGPTITETITFNITYNCDSSNNAAYGGCIEEEVEGTEEGNTSESTFQYTLSKGAEVSTLTLTVTTSKHKYSETDSRIYFGLKRNANDGVGNHIINGHLYQLNGRFEKGIEESFVIDIPGAAKPVHQADIRYFTLANRGDDGWLLQSVKLAADGSTKYVAHPIMFLDGDGYTPVASFGPHDQAVLAVVSTGSEGTDDTVYINFPLKTGRDVNFGTVSDEDVAGLIYDKGNESRLEVRDGGNTVSLILNWELSSCSTNVMTGAVIGTGVGLGLTGGNPAGAGIGAALGAGADALFGGEDCSTYDDQRSGGTVSYAGHVYNDNPIDNEFWVEMDGTDDLDISEELFLYQPRDIRSCYHRETESTKLGDCGDCDTTHGTNDDPLTISPPADNSQDTDDACDDLFDTDPNNSKASYR